MTVASQMQRPWDTYDYQRIVSASYRDGEVIVTFADGAEARVAPRALVSPRVAAPDWSKVQAEEFHLVVPSSAGTIEIPWDVIRVHSDPAYEAFWAALAEEPLGANVKPRVKPAV